jgi:hypothetical protein
MAIVKGSYTRSRGAAKANIGYITKRPGKDKEKITRTLFGLDGVMTSREAYRMIDQAKEGSYYYRLVLSPDPIGEDTRQDLDMRELTLQTMQVLDARLNKALVWAGALHADHKPHRHVHILAVSPRRLTVKDFARLRLEATRESLAQRRTLDFGQEPKTRQRFTTYQTLKYDRTARQPSRVARGGSAARMHTCTCPRCGTPHIESGRNRVHQCTCGLTLHRPRALRLPGKGREWER